MNEENTLHCGTSLGRIRKLCTVVNYGLQCLQMTLTAGAKYDMKCSCLKKLGLLSSELDDLIISNVHPMIIIPTIPCILL